jgi:copper chaperone CopZ
MTEVKFYIKGTHCKSCKMLITDVLEDLGVTIKSFDMDEGKKESNLVVDTDIESQKIIDMIQSEGEYTVKLVK